MKSKKHLSAVSPLECPLHGKDSPCVRKEMIVNLKSDSECAWWINSEDHDYCFWTYIYDNSNSDGVMSELNQGKIAKLLNCNSSQILQMIDDAMKELESVLKSTSGDSLSDLEESSDYDLSIDSSKFQTDL